MSVCPGCIVNSQAFTGGFQSLIHSPVSKIAIRLIYI